MKKPPPAEEPQLPQNVPGGEIQSETQDILRQDFTLAAHNVMVFPNASHILSL